MPHHTTPERDPPARPGTSLFRESLALRLALAAGLSALVWLVIAWAKS